MGAVVLRNVASVLGGKRDQIMIPPMHKIAHVRTDTMPHTCWAVNICAMFEFSELVQKLANKSCRCPLERRLVVNPTLSGTMQGVDRRLSDFTSVVVPVGELKCRNEE